MVSSRSYLLLCFTTTTLFFLAYHVDAKACCSDGFDPAGIAYSKLSGRVCRNAIPNNGFRMEPFQYSNGTVYWSNEKGCRGDAASITHNGDHTEFVLNAIRDPTGWCNNTVFKVYNNIRSAGDYSSVTMVLGDGKDCGSGPFQLDCEARPCCQTNNCPEPPARPSSGGGGFGGLCLSESTLVDVMIDKKTKKIQQVPLKDLKIGDKVLTTSTKGFQPVYSFGHYDLESSAEFLVIHTTNNNNKDQNPPPIEITRDHMLFRRNEKVPVPAGSIKVGDELQALWGQPAQVIKIETIHKQGLYAPLTQSGTVVINGGIVVSSYITLQENSTYLTLFQGIETPMSQELSVHILLAPHRLLTMGMMGLGEFHIRNNSGMPWWIDFGIHYMKIASNQQNVVVETIMLLISFSFCLWCYLLESVFGVKLAPLVFFGSIYYCLFKKNKQNKNNKNNSNTNNNDETAAGVKNIC